MSSGEDKIRAKIKEIEDEYARTQKNKATEVSSDRLGMHNVFAILGLVWADDEFYMSRTFPKILVEPFFQIR